MCGEFHGGIRVGRRREKIRGDEFMEVDFGSVEKVQVVEPEFSLVDVGGRGGVIDQDIVRGDEARELDELIEMALQWKRHHDCHHLILFKAVWILAWMWIMGIHG
ncbi:hypothetical protein U1Q18_040226 [Sarracenia purpurea var. burkii]